MSAGKVMAAIFWDVQGITVVGFTPRGVNAVGYQATL
jgi:hypothetical protein